MASKPSVPDAPDYSAAPTPEPFAPSYQTYNQMASNTRGARMAEARTSTKLSKEATYELNRAALDVMLESAPQLAATKWGIETSYAPGYAKLYQNIINKNDPMFMQVRGQLADNISSELSAGYNLGSALEREVTQDIRAAQDARGNYYGPAPTADEAFYKGSARQAMYQQRLGNAQTFVNSKSPIDMYNELRMATESTQYYAPQIQQAQYDVNAPMNLTQQEYANQQNYFTNQLNSYDLSQQYLYKNFDAQMQNYNAYWDQYTFSNSGMYGGGGGGGGGGAGMAGQLVGAGISAIGSAGAAAGGAIASGAGATAVASAAALALV